MKLSHPAEPSPRLKCCHQRPAAKINPVNEDHEVDYFVPPLREKQYRHDGEDQSGQSHEPQTNASPGGSAMARELGRRHEVAFRELVFDVHDIVTIL